MRNNKVLFLDFDGVIIDSSRETARTAWLAGSELWDEWKGVDIPRSTLSKFVKLRPLLETGYDAIALVRAIDDGYSENFLKSNFSFMKQQIFTSVSMNRENLVKLFGRVRDDWAEIDFKGWIRHHRLYNCAPAIIECGENHFRKTFIVTTKEKRFTEKLLAAAGIDFDPGMIYGLESGVSKSEMIAAILETEKLEPESAVIVEDMVKTLSLFASDSRLKTSSLFLASWGFVFPEDVKTIAEKNSNITVLGAETAAQELEKASSA